jgi:hypothetical protein
MGGVEISTDQSQFGRAEVSDQFEAGGWPFCAEQAEGRQGHQEIAEGAATQNQDSLHHPVGSNGQSEMGSNPE